METAPPVPPDGEQANNPSTERAPLWVGLLGMPVWVTADDGSVTYLNPRAEELIGRPADQCIGRLCHRVIGGRKPSGGPFCQSNCAVQRLAKHGREIEPFPLRLSRKGKRDQQVRIVVIAAQAPIGLGTLYVHCVVDDARHERFRKYLTKVVSRSPHAGEEITLDTFQLTPREREILRLLSEDETLHGIAHRLNLSYATIRNHVQHILTKLGVHSILEAVAFYLLVED